MAIIASFISPIIAFLDSIPACVMGGVCMSLYGFIAVSGLKMLQPVDLNKNRNLFVATISTIATALILGILVNIILSGKKDDSEE